MSYNVPLHIACTEAIAAAEKCEGLEDRLRAAMNATKNHWLITDEIQRFQAAVAAVVEISDESTKERLLKEYRMLMAFGQQDWTAFLAHAAEVEDQEFEPIGLWKLWREIARGEL